MGRFRFVAKRLLLTVPLLLGIVLLVFLVLKMAPGDPARQIVGLRASRPARAGPPAALGLDDPVLTSTSATSATSARRPRLLVQVAAAGEHGGAAAPQAPDASSVRSRGDSPCPAEPAAGRAKVLLRQAARLGADGVLVAQLSRRWCTASSG